MQKKIIFIKLILVGMFLIPGITYGEYNGALADLFFRRQPSARAEALGKSYIAIGEDAFASFYNPAGVASDKGFSFGSSYSNLSNLYYAAEDARFIFFGANVQLKKHYIIGLSRYHFYYRTLIRRLSKDKQVIEEFISNESISTATITVKLGNNFWVGTNANLIQQKFGNTGNDYAYSGDIGILKIFELHNSSKLKEKIKIGASLSNFTNSEIFKDDLPIIFRLGSSYKIAWLGDLLFSNSKTIELLFHIEYQDLLNSKYGNGFKLGGEVLFLEIIAFRVGYYREDHSYATYKRNILKEKTYGFGIQLPIYKISSQNIPLNVIFDMTRLPKSSKAINREYFSIYNLSIDWYY